MIPLRDHNPRQSFPYATLALVAANVAIFLWQLSLPPGVGERLVLAAGAIPREIISRVDLPPADLVPPPATILTAMFLHGGFLHLLGNMWFLWLFGDNIEDRLGRVRFLIFYFVTGIVGALAQCAMDPSSPVPMIGASGAVAGVLGAYILAFPRARVVTLVPIPFLFFTTEIPAWVFLGFWFVGQFFVGDGSGIAWMAHVGGFLAGLGLVRLFAPQRRPIVVEAEYIPPPRVRPRR